jgi:Endoribonuclease L-PSP
VTALHEVVESPRVPGRGPYSQAVRLGDLLFIAGQAGLDPSSGALAGTTFEHQARQAFDNLRAILEDAGTGLDGVVKTTCFLAVPTAPTQRPVRGVLPRGATGALGPSGPAARGSVVLNRGHCGRSSTAGTAAGNVT